MTKKIIKEIIISLLLGIVILLVLGIILYDYIPINKEIPEVKKYQMSNDVKANLEQTVNFDENKISLTHDVTKTDISNFKKQKKYLAGNKENPFSLYREGVLGGYKTLNEYYEKLEKYYRQINKELDDELKDYIKNKDEEEQISEKDNTENKDKEEQISEKDYIKDYIENENILEQEKNPTK